MDEDWARRQNHRLAAPGEIVGAAAADLDRRVGGRLLPNGAAETLERRLDVRASRPGLARSDDFALGVVRAALLPPSNGEGVGFRRGD